MGNIKVLVRDPESVNFDKICRLAVEIGDRTYDAIEVVNDGPYDLDIEGDAADREYWKVKGRSMTELYAIRTWLGKADASGTMCVSSTIPGLVPLCQLLAENHGKVQGVQGGSLYKKGMIPAYAKGLTLLPERASEIVGRIVKVVVASLKDAQPALAFQAGEEWDGLDAALASAERAVYVSAREIARSLQQGRYVNGRTFPLASSSGAYAPQGVAIETRNPNLMKHLWAALKGMEPSFRVAVAVVSHPDTGRIAVLCSTQYPVDIRPAAKALSKRFPKAEFDVNHERNSIVWDPRSKTVGPSAAEVQEIVSKHFAFRQDDRPIPGPRIGATLGDAFRRQEQQKRR